MRTTQCEECGQPTWRRRFCSIHTDPPVNPTTGLFRCCGGMAPEHFDGCTVGDAIAYARRAIARAQARRP